MECPECKEKSLAINDENSYSCTNPKCGIITDEKPFIEDQYIEPAPRLYTRKIDCIQSHNFKKIIVSMQGIETRQITRKLMNEIKNYHEKHNLKYTHDNIYKYLKSKRRTMFYPHIPVIYYKLTGYRPKTIPTYIEDKLLKMFKRIEINWVYARPDERYNLPNYNFIMKKLLELIEER